MRGRVQPQVSVWGGGCSSKVVSAGLRLQIRCCSVASNAQDPGLIPSTGKKKKKSVFPNTLFFFPKVVLVGKVIYLFVFIITLIECVYVCEHECTMVHMGSQRTVCRRWVSLLLPCGAQGWDPGHHA